MATDDPHPAVPIDVPLVRGLIARQFPEYEGLAIRPVASSGWDNRTFHLGDHLSVRLPSAAHYASSVEKEQRWLPRLAPHLPLPIATPVAMGEPDDAFPWPWSIYRWLEGTSASVANIDDLDGFAAELAAFLNALRAIDTVGGPEPGRRTSQRGGPVAVFDRATRDAIEAVRAEVDPVAATEIWEAALAAPWRGPPVWVHGDVAAGNLIVREGRLAAVIDFGQLVVGDPACDMVIAWTLLTRSSRAVFRSAHGVDDDTWARGRGWALWKALIIRAGFIESNALETAAAPRVIAELLADHAARRAGRPD